MHTSHSLHFTSSNVSFIFAYLEKRQIIDRRLLNHSIIDDPKMNVLIDKTREAAQRRNLLRLMLKNQVFKFGEFQLKSGQMSPIYIDLRECFGYFDLMELSTLGLMDIIKDSGLSYEAIVGVPYAALPYSTLLAHRVQKPLIIIRKEAKDYGTKKLIEGLYKPGQKVIIMEDVVTTGGSVKTVTATLRKAGLIVEDVFCLLNREQGGADKLKEDGINLHSLLNMETILTFLLSTKAINQETWEKIVKALSLPYESARTLDISLELENVSSFPLVSSGRLPLTERAENAVCPLNKKLYALMAKKQSNLCLAVDYTESEKIMELVKKASSYVVAIKIHSDIISDFSKQFTDKLVQLANDEEFLIFEDRKFGDIGNTNLLQLKGSHSIANWADLVTVHAVQGSDSISTVFREVINDTATRLSGILLIGQLSSKGNLTNMDGYTEAVAGIGAANRDVVAGFICQARVSEHSDMLHWTPGVNLDATSDNAGQQWRGIDKAILDQQNDIIIVGRGITASAQPVQDLKRYREAAWAALAHP